MTIPNSFLPCSIIHLANMSPQITSKQSARKVKSEKALKSPPPSSSEGSQQDAESVRGRRQDRDSSEGAKVDEISDDDGEGPSSKSGNGQPRKRKRSRKGLDKKYHCPHEGCGKSYSRAEHLYRHQLNRKSWISSKWTCDVLTDVSRHTEADL